MGKMWCYLVPIPAIGVLETVENVEKVLATQSRTFQVRRDATEAVTCWRFAHWQLQCTEYNMYYIL